MGAKRERTDENVSGEIFKELAACEEISDDELQRDVGGSSVYTQGLDHCLNTASHKQIHSQVNWLEGQMRADYQSEVNQDNFSDGGTQAPANVSEAGSELKSYLKDHNSELTSDGIGTFVRNWENEVNSASTNGFMLNQIGQEIVSDWNQIHPATSINTSGGGATVGEAGFVTGGLQMNTGSATTQQEIAQAQTLEKTLDAADAVSNGGSGHDTQYIEAESQKLLGILEHNGHVLDASGEQNFIQNVCTSIDYTNQLREGGDPGFMCVPDSYAMGAQGKSQESNNEQVMASMDHHLSTDLSSVQAAEPGIGITTSELDKQVLQAEEQDTLTTGLSTQWQQETIQTIESRDGIEGGLQAIGMADTLVQEEATVQNSLGKTIIGNLGPAGSQFDFNMTKSQLTEEIEGIAGPNLMSSQEEQATMQKLEGQLGITLVNQVESLHQQLQGDYQILQPFMINPIAKGGLLSAAVDAVENSLDKGATALASSELEGAAQEAMANSGISTGEKIQQIDQSVNAAFELSDGFLNNENITQPSLLSQVKTEVQGFVTAGKTFHERQITNDVLNADGIMQADQFEAGLVASIENDETHLYSNSNLPPGNIAQELQQAAQQEQTAGTFTMTAENGLSLIQSVENQSGITTMKITDQIDADFSSLQEYTSVPNQLAFMNADVSQIVSQDIANLSGGSIGTQVLTNSTGRLAAGSALQNEQTVVNEVENQFNFQQAIENKNAIGESSWQIAGNYLGSGFETLGNGIVEGIKDVANVIDAPIHQAVDGANTVASDPTSVAGWTEILAGAAGVVGTAAGSWEDTQPIISTLRYALNEIDETLDATGAAED